MALDKHLIAQTNPIANSDNLIKGDGYRITVLTDELIRVENGVGFTDEATQSVWFRNFGKIEFKIIKENNTIFIETKKVRFWFNIKSKKVYAVTFLYSSKTVKCSNQNNLKGTYRTLDFVPGRVPLKKGIMSRSGVSIMDDSKSLLLINGEVEPRQHKTKDLYIFAYNNNYRECLYDFFRLTGNVPLIPRYALGNWWSRYRAYTQQEYIDLMEKFKKLNIPITVATVDMDWHWVDVNKKFNFNGKGRLSQGPGWTGYSWDTDLFPDYKAFLKYLHDNNYRTTLNLHPADGVRWFEDMYKEMAEEMGIDYRSKQAIEFDITNPKFINAYFKILHNPYEDEGVDFWWIDWQQGKNTKLKGLDPLWSLNHYHFLNSARKNRRPLILSRYAEEGSHRYPLGFSGDTFIYWSNFKFQPYFTATAANIGYTWWSHDIGGHMYGIKSDELYLRWLQFGVFSPINRLHSTSHDLQGKEPWNYSDYINKYAKEYLSFRHKLIPYIYTMNYRTYTQGIALCEPMYYQHSDNENAYNFKTQYYFGSELLVCPAVTKINKKLAMSKTKVWLPKGRWTDIFTGKIYQGDKVVNMHRGIENIAVLAREGAILPLSNNNNNDNDWSNPKDLTLYIYRGNNVFDLYEDDGESNDYLNNKYAITKFDLRENKAIEFTINKAEGELSVIPDKRRYNLIFKDIIQGDVTVEINGNKTNETTKCNNNKDNELALTIDILPTDTVKITINSYQIKTNGDFKQNAKNLMSKYQIGNISKMLMYRKFKKLEDKQQYISAAKKLRFRYKPLRYALLELLEE